MGLYESMQTSQRLESDGIWLDLGHTRILLARAGGRNTKFIAEAERIARKNKRALDQMGEAQGRKMFGRIFAETIVRDWLTLRKDGNLNEFGQPATEDDEHKYVRGIDRPDGEIVEPTADNIAQTFDDIPDLLRIVKETAEDPELYKQSLVADIEGNSKRS